VVARRGVLHNDNVFGLHADISQLSDRGRAVVEQPPPIFRIGPCLGDDLGSVERTDVGLVGGDDRVQHLGIYEASFGEQLLQRLGTQGGRNALTGFAHCHVIFSR
jgi:hypothetical protein